MFFFSKFISNHYLSFCSFNYPKLPSVISLAEILAALQADYRLCGLERSRGTHRFFCLFQFVYNYYKRCGANIPVASQFWLAAYIVWLFGPLILLVYFSGLNAPQCPTSDNNFRLHTFLRAKRLTEVSSKLIAHFLRLRSRSNWNFRDREQEESSYWNKKENNTEET